MTHIVFFEKPGCAGNARQCAALEAAGHTVERRNLLTSHWTPERLLTFLGALPVAQWFNRAAPRVKSGEVQPDTLNASEAMALLLAEPLLIRRPLMQRRDDGRCLVGFETAAVQAWVGLADSPASIPASLEGCIATNERCPAPSTEEPVSGVHHADV
ncbi:MAG TPA: ArsC/Spx/MgsR family protein [Hydrogenophaga sp.]